MVKFEWTDELVKEFGSATVCNLKDFVMNPDQFTEDFKKSKTPPIFITKDGVGIYSGDEYWLLNEGILEKKFAHGVGYTSDRIRFHSFDKAVEYTVYNLSCLSLNDLLDGWIEADKKLKDSIPQDRDVFKTSPLFKTFLEIAKKKYEK